MEIKQYQEKVVELCHRYGVRELALFGSAARDVMTEQSDLDFLVDFLAARPQGAFERYFGLKEALEALFQRSVDLVEVKAIQNPYFREAIERDKVMVYEAGSQ
jgi:hypothetical protein